MPEWAELWRKTGQEAFGSSGTTGSKKDSDRAITPVVEAICVPAHLAPPGPSAKQLRYLHAQLSLGQSRHRQKISCVYAHSCFGSVQLFVTLRTVACQAFLSGTGILQVRILECIGQYWLLYHSRALYFLLP